MISPCLFLQRLGVDNLDIPLPATMREIAIRVAEAHGLTLADLRGPSRQRHIAWPRHEAFALVRDNTAQSLPQIGRYFGDRDHTTVLWGIRGHERRVRGLAPVRRVYGKSVGIAAE